MTIANTSYFVRADAVEPFLRLAREVCVPALHAAGASEAILCHVSDDPGQGHSTYAIQARFATRAEAERWHEETGVSLTSQIATALGPDNLMHLTTLMDII